MLFRGSRGNSAAIRNVAGGHFDHVALIIRTDEEGLDDFCIIEAVGNGGVSATTWRHIRREIGVGKFYEKVAFRKVNCVRNFEFLRILNEFVNEAWEHEYGIDLCKLLVRSSFVLKPESQKKYVAEGRTFFCSELVAKAYKVLGIMNTDRPSASFFPKHFTAQQHRHEE